MDHRRGDNDSCLSDAVSALYKTDSPEETSKFRITTLRFLNLCIAAPDFPDLF